MPLLPPLNQLSLEQKADHVVAAPTSESRRLSYVVAAPISEVGFSSEGGLGELAVVVLHPYRRLSRPPWALRDYSTELYTEVIPAWVVLCHRVWDLGMLCLMGQGILEGALRFCTGNVCALLRVPWTDCACRTKF